MPCASSNSSSSPFRAVPPRPSLASRLGCCSPLPTCSGVAIVSPSVSSPLLLWPPCSLSTALTALPTTGLRRGARGSEPLPPPALGPPQTWLGAARTGWNWYGPVLTGTHRGRPAAPPRPGEWPPPWPSTPPAEACRPQGRGAAAMGRRPGPLATNSAALPVPAEPGIPARRCQPLQPRSPPSLSGPCSPWAPAAACVGDSVMDLRSGCLGHRSLLL